MEKTTEPKTKVKPEVKQEAVKPFSKSDQVHSNPKVKAEVKPTVPAPVPTPTAPIEKPVVQVVPEQPVPLTLESLHKAILLLKAEFIVQAQQLEEVQAILAKKRKAVPNGKVQIKDSLTGKVYRSKNNAYKSLLISGELAELVKQGVFGADPAKNTFGWYALNRAFPNRFEEIKAEVPEQQA